MLLLALRVSPAMQALAQRLTGCRTLPGTHVGDARLCFHSSLARQTPVLRIETMCIYYQVASNRSRQSATGYVQLMTTLEQAQKPIPLRSAQSPSPLFWPFPHGYHELFARGIPRIDPPNGYIAYRTHNTWHTSHI